MVVIINNKPRSNIIQLDMDNRNRVLTVVDILHHLNSSNITVVTERLSLTEATILNSNNSITKAAEAAEVLVIWQQSFWERF